MTNDDQVLLTNNVRCWLVRPSEIAIFTIDGNYVTVTLFDGQKLTIRHSFSRIKKKLDRNFFQAHRSCIVNIAAIKKVQYYDRRRLLVTMADGTGIVLSQQQTHQFKKLTFF